LPYAHEVAVVSSSSRTSTPASSDPRARVIERIAVGIDGFDEGRDAAVLGAMIARATGAELLLVAVHPDPLIVLPRELGWTGLRRHAEASLRETRDALAPGARIDVETDWSVPRALERVVNREQRDLLVVGSSRRGPEGCVRIGKRTRQLLCHCTCALAVAPRGLSARPARELARLGVGYDGGPESRAALAVAGSIAQAAGAQLGVRGVVDDRLPAVGWTHSERERVEAMWDELLEPEFRSLREEAQRAAAAMSVAAEIEVLRGRPADALLELGDQVDLLVIGSRRWGTVARVLLGSTGEALMHDACCPVMVVPRPDTDNGTQGPSSPA
jgi:nucleotide-binding universal stress UspA family protein